MTALTKYKWFWAWDDEKEENWLRAMALQGWHLSQVDMPCVYTFEQGSPGDITYRLDFFTGRKDKVDYYQLFQDAGWEHVGHNGSWQYFRKASTDGEAPEIYTTTESKIKKYQRVIMVLVIAIFLLVSGTFRSLGKVDSWFYEIINFFWFLILLLLCYGIMMLLHRIYQLRKK